MTVIEFDGIPFNPVAGSPVVPAATPAEHTDAATTSGREHATASSRSERPSGDTVALRFDNGGTGAEGSPMAGQIAAAVVGGGSRDAKLLSEIRSGVVAAHRSALTAQVALQRAAWQRTLRAATSARVASTDPAAAATGGVSVDGRAIAARGQRAGRDGLSNGTGSAGVTAAEPVVAAAESAFKALARTRCGSLDHAALVRLTEGDVVSVFGAGYQRSGVASVARLAASGPLVLTEVVTIELRGGTGKGRVVAHFDGDPRAAAVQAAEVFALFTGMQLCLSGSTLTAAQVSGAVEGIAAGTMDLVVTDIDLVLRPHVTATASIAGAQGELRVTVTVVEPVGAGVGPGEAAPGLLLNEFHMTHLSRGDQSIAMGPEFAEYTGVRATRLPTGGLLLVDRVIEFDGARGRLDGAAYTSEYDSPADSWYYGDTANESMPHFVYMETSLQAALLMGYYAGPTLTQPGVTLSLRNLGGTATILRQLDLRDKTIEQSSRLLSTTILPGSSLQTFDYTLSVDGEPFYSGETMFGYFSDEALANQTGLDAGKAAPTWLDEHAGAPIRTIDVAARRADPHAGLCARRTLALIDHIDVVDGGGKYQAGYLHSLRAIDASDWYFDRHFHLDPVIPGSLGVESVIHAVQEWILDAGFADSLSDPVFRIPADIAFSWRYRGQFLPTDGTVELEAHIKEVRRGPHGVTVIVDGSLWKPGLRIYELSDLAVELGERKDGS
ncbi:beta-ketoacyl synthase [Nocardia sp. NBC_01499]|uniref:beta-ketoacyl synthase n=1 Tax=Nocardia sp. NBC_01499 TaxID=2903597 RepID=UPI00386F4BFB